MMVTHLVRVCEGNEFRSDPLISGGDEMQPHCARLLLSFLSPTSGSIFVSAYLDAINNHIVVNAPPEVGWESLPS